MVSALQTETGSNDRSSDRTGSVTVFGPRSWNTETWKWRSHDLKSAGMIMCQYSGDAVLWCVGHFLVLEEQFSGCFGCSVTDSHKLVKNLYFWQTHHKSAITWRLFCQYSYCQHAFDKFLWSIRRHSQHFIKSVESMCLTCCRFVASMFWPARANALMASLLQVVNMLSTWFTDRM